MAEETHLNINVSRYAAGNGGPLGLGDRIVREDGGGFPEGGKGG
jgi:hypothetical protein